MHAAEVGDRAIQPGSRVFVTVDTTEVPGADVSVPALRVNGRGDGYVTVSTLSGDPTDAQSGVPFEYLAVNAAGGSIGAMSYISGHATIPAGQHNVGVSAIQAKPDSTILLTVDESDLATDVPVAGVKINNKGNGYFSVTTLDLSNAPSPTGIPFDWMVVNGPTSERGTTAIPKGQYHVGLTNGAIRRTSAVLLTADATSLGGASDVQLPSVKLNNHGDGFATVTTVHDSNAPAGGVPFDWLVVDPPARWEEYGPTAESGNVWTIAVDPTNRDVVYTGSSWGGVWKSSDGGQTWHEAWNQPETGIYSLALSPADHRTLFALDSDAQVWRSTDAGLHWTQLPKPPLSVDTSGAILRAPSDGSIWVCSRSGGLMRLASPTAPSWTHEDPVPSNHDCTDVVFDPLANAYAAIENAGVYSRYSKLTTWRSVTTDSTIASRAMRLAIGQDELVIDSDQHLTVIVSPLDPGQRIDRGKWCGDGQDGYALAVGIAPPSGGESHDLHWIAFGNCGFVTFNNGASFFPDNRGDNNPGETVNHDAQYRDYHTGQPTDHLDVGQDDHQVLFLDDKHLALATDRGPRFSSDGGKTWTDTWSGESRLVNGPPVTEFYNLDVSRPDRFGRVIVDGNVQDAGALAVFGNRFGMGAGGGERGVSVAAAPRPGTSGGMQSTIVRFYGNDTSGDGTALIRTEYNVPGPYWVSPPQDEEGDGWYPAQTPLGPVQVVLPNGKVGATFPADISSIATHPTQYDEAVVGLTNGDVYRSVAGSDGSRYQRLVENPFGGADVTSLDFVTPDALYVGYQNGRVVGVRNPFAASPVMTYLPSDGSTMPVVKVAIDQAVSPAELYIATQNSLFRTADDDVHRENAIDTSSALEAQLAGLHIVGIAIDAPNGRIYVATGTGGSGTVWRNDIGRESAQPWVDVGAGLPPGIPITSIGIADGEYASGTNAIPERALFISTLGRGIWWRRDLG
jgi:hypothetical protein